MVDKKVKQGEENNAMDLRQTILSSKDIREEIITIDSWGVDILVRGLTGEARNSVLTNNINPKTKQVDIGKAYPELIIATAYNPKTREKIFKMADRDALNKKSGEALEEIAKKAMELSGITVKEMGEIEKN